MLRRSVLLCLAAAATGCGWQSDPGGRNATDVQYRTGDDERWAQLEWDGREWQRFPIRDAPAPTGLFWVRLDVPLDAVRTPMLDVAAVAARDVYWDGVLIGQVGHVGQDRTTSTTRPSPASCGRARSRTSGRTGCAWPTRDPRPTATS